MWGRGAVPFRGGWESGYKRNGRERMGGILCSAKLFLGKTLTDRNRHIHQSRRKGRSYVMLTRGRPKPLLSVPAETRPQLRNDNKVVTEPAGKTFMKSFSRSQSDWSIKVCYTYKLQQINNKICLFWPVADQWGMRDGATLWQRHGRYMKERDMSCDMFSVWSVHLRRHAKTRFHLRP